MLGYWLFFGLFPGSHSRKPQTTIPLFKVFKTDSRGQAQTYFQKKRGIALGLVVAGSSIGGVIFPQMAQHLIPEIGFGWTVRACAFLILGMLIFANLSISSNLEHTRKPFNIMDYVRPLGEANYLIMAAASFFLYCEYTSKMEWVRANTCRGSLTSGKGVCLYPSTTSSQRPSTTE